MQYHAIPCNTMQYHAIPCGQYMAIFEEGRPYVLVSIRNNRVRKKVSLGACLAEGGRGQKLLVMLVRTDHFSKRDFPQLFFNLNPGRTCTTKNCCIYSHFTVFRLCWVKNLQRPCGVGGDEEICR